MPINQYYNRFPFDKAIQNIEAFKTAVEAQLRVEALQYQHEVADYMQENFKRKADSTGRLVNATIDRRNANFGAATWTVPNVQFLSQSQAKYWRLIEQGSANLYAGGKGFRGAPLYFFGDRGRARPFRSLPKGGTYESLFGSGDFRGKGRIRFVRNEIQPMNAYAIVYADKGWPERIRRDFREIARLKFQQ